MYYDQAWLEKMRLNRHDSVSSELWLKECRVDPERFQYYKHKFKTRQHISKSCFRRKKSSSSNVAVSIREFLKND